MDLGTQRPDARTTPGAAGALTAPLGLITPQGDHAITAHPLAFSGSGGEFFRVWIVNVLLTIVTLGFYTPFARRRTAQYFYGHTLVAGSPLEFTAQQRKMVLGFLLLVLVYLAYKIAADTGQDLAATLLLAAGAALAPYLWGSAMRFRLSATRWRGVRLAFAAPWREVYGASWPVFAIALLWIATAFVARALAPAAGKGIAGLLVVAALVLTLLCVIRLEFNYKSLLVKRTRVGQHAGRWKPEYRDFVRIWLATVAVFLASVVAVFALLAVLALVFGGSMAMLSGLGPRLGVLAVLVFVLLGLGFIFVLLLASAPARAYREARMFRLVWSNVGVGQVARFKCKLKTRRYVLLRVKNIFLTLCTLGFYRPFARVAEYRMKVESVTLHVKGGVDQLAGQLVEQQGGLGDAAADAVGLDLVG